MILSVKLCMIKKESYGIGEKQFTLSVFNYFTNIKFN